MGLPDLAGALRTHREWLAVRARVLGPTLRTVSLTPPASVRGAVLISYLTEAYDRRRGAFPAAHHSNLWQGREMARTFLELGYAVDVINFRNFLHRPRRDYDAFVDIRFNMERLAPELGDDCVKIQHLETAHMLFQNTAEFRRLLDVQRRRGVTLQPRRVERRINHGIEHADHAVLYGNAHSASTWAYAGTPMYRVPGTPIRQFDRPHRDIERVRRNFLWMGSNGFVLKGLDLVLEAFAGMPDLHLTVCGPLDDEPDFVAAFHRELYETPNITTLGWVDVGSRRFLDLATETLALVYPSASESQAGAVLTAMHAGLVPIVTPEADVPVEPAYGRTIAGLTVEDVRTAVREVSELPTATLAAMTDATWEHARATHTFEAFSSAYRRIVRGLLGEDDPPEPYRPSVRES